MLMPCNINLQLFYLMLIHYNLYLHLYYSMLHYH